MFKRAFGQKNIMIPFLNAVLKTDTIIDIDYRNVENWGLSPEDRKVFYDVYLRTSVRRPGRVFCYLQNMERRKGRQG